MKLDGIRENYQFYTGKASELARQSVLAGLAIVWIFKVDQAGIPKMPHRLVWPTLLLAVTLLLDFAQYLYGSIAYDTRYRICEKKKQHSKFPDGHDFKIPHWLLWPMDACFYGKVVSVIIAYGFLSGYLIRQLFV